MENSIQNVFNKNIKKEYIKKYSHGDQNAQRNIFAENEIQILFDWPLIFEGKTEASVLFYTVTIFFLEETKWKLHQTPKTVIHIS